MFVNRTHLFSFLPHLFLCLQKRRFAELLKKSFPNCKISEERKELARNLLMGILRRTPRSRPSVKRILLHPLFTKSGASEVLIPDSMWFVSKQGELTYDLVFRNSKVAHKTSYSVA